MTRPFGLQAGPRIARRERGGQVSKHIHGARDRTACPRTLIGSSGTPIKRIRESTKRSLHYSVARRVTTLGGAESLGMIANPLPLACMRVPPTEMFVGTAPQHPNYFGNDRRKAVIFAPSIIFFLK
jgi:hypothetical protein